MEQEFYSCYQAISIQVGLLFPRIDESKTFLFIHSSEIYNLLNLNEDCCHNEKKRISSHPIQRNHILPLRDCAPVSFSLKEFLSNNKWSNKNQKNLVGVWKKYCDDRELVLERLIKDWNEDRSQLVRDSQMIPLTIASVELLDKNWREYVSWVTKIFQLNFLAQIVRISGQTIPEKWIKIIQDLKSGSNMCLSSKLSPDTLLFLNNSFKSRIGPWMKLKKKNVCIKAKLSLEQLNSWLNSRSI
jgi:hypothetical protein